MEGVCEYVYVCVSVVGGRGGGQWGWWLNSCRLLMKETSPVGSSSSLTKSAFWIAYATGKQVVVNDRKICVTFS